MRSCTVARLPTPPPAALLAPATHNVFPANGRTLRIPSISHPCSPEGGAVLQPALAQLLVQLHRVAGHRGWRKRKGEGQAADLRVYNTDSH